MKTLRVTPLVSTLKECNKVSTFASLCKSLFCFLSTFLSRHINSKVKKNIFIYVLLKNRKWRWKYFTQYKKKLRKSANNYFVNQKGLLTLIRMGLLAVLFVVCFGRGNITACLKPVSIMLEEWNLIRKYADTFSFRKYTF